MRTWNLKAGDPLSLTFAADARRTPADYTNDQIWRLQLGGGEPPALAFQTTFGLRARSLRLFPQFYLEDETRTDPESFALSPVIQQFYPNFLALQCAPFPDVDVLCEYWVPQSQGAAGRLTLYNGRHTPVKLRLSWVAQLSPTDGQRMAPMEIQTAQALSGTTGGLAPVVLLTGTTQVSIGAYPALVVDLELAPGATHQAVWAHAALVTAEESFALARTLASHNWDAESTHLDLLNASQVDVHTGDPDWDAALSLSQKQALGLFIGPQDGLPHRSFVLTRQPDQGFSLRGDGSDYNHLWNGQTPLESLYLADLVLPGYPELAEELLFNFLAVQDEAGFIDWKPGLAGQRSRLLAPPLLCELAWRIYSVCEKPEFLAAVFPGLLHFLNHWLCDDYDRDGDSLPEWTHPMQVDSDDHPLYAQWHSWSLGAEINTAESVALCAMLYREAATLKRIAETIGQDEAIPALESLCEHMQGALDAAWDLEAGTYYDWDRDVHSSAQSRLLSKRTGPGEIPINRRFRRPARLLIQIFTQGETTRRPNLVIDGQPDGDGSGEKADPGPDFKWYFGRGSLTTQAVYRSLEQLKIEGIDPQDEVRVYRLGHRSDFHTNLLPLWAKAASPENAAILVSRTLTDPTGYWRPYGIPSCARAPRSPDDGACQNVHLLWNTLHADGLLAYGFRQEAAELVTRMMRAIVANLKRENNFRRYYNADSGRGAGDRDALSGLAPVGLFLRVLGVRILSPYTVDLQGFNPFPWPVTVKYRGLTLLCQKDKTIAIFPDGQTVTVDDPAPCRVSLEFQGSEPRERP